MVQAYQMKFGDLDEAELQTLIESIENAVEAEVVDAEQEDGPADEGDGVDSSPETEESRPIPESPA
jgi:hypothetical protein